MTALEDLAARLGGGVRFTGRHHWLDTTIGGLRAAVIGSSGPITKTTTYELAVFMPDARELEPFFRPSERWRLDGDAAVIPRLQHRFVFAGCHAGVLFARSSSAPSLEEIVGALWELSAWARKPWRPMTEDERNGWKARERRRALVERLTQFGFVALLVILIAILRRRR